ncbi:TIGR03943 family putative permease subunit [Saccharopolyspora mangrovi]|uniref:TIGR03943 family protein n=1 Tax=Saccharopolyspora mangrovi TaxID=3082379 RepID=A0ABU6A959_9PSEU|nr:TIGR03943 family protein [Saccharopolyspora sp. S2-29]MEB3367890.1 TIGR03943 family protein [Saccharopolyspora sp. S2-29]
MRRETQNVLLVLLGGALLKISLTGGYLRYVKPSLQPWLVVAGAVMILLAGFAIVRDIRAGHAVDQHEHGTRSPWMLLLPVFAIFLVAPPALGSDSVTRDRAASAPAAPSQAKFPPLPAGEAPVLSMSEFLTRVVWDDSGELNDRTVTLQGFVVHPTPQTTQLARMRISCCAADATPVKIDLASPRAEALPADTWIEITGRLRPGTATEANDYVPTVDPLTITPIPAPPDTYEY